MEEELPATICEYCKKPIEKDEDRGVLCMSRLVHHLDCYTKMFKTEKNTLRARMFRLKNSWLAFVDKILFWFHYHYYIIFKMPKEKK